ncbi:hypothetical protein MCOR25_001135 [Pyricularia grisea]|uniref:Uncharacterized protein n=1 Tax=Pyricularia grisea TaxID=148305 RepID=A0A6P8ANY5_PYRGI|nr:uncharacterized protein PgNI_11766 [Pyricularia grisea]KAI6381666.1 hypothetical protein MCOR25_001135 [Pyricularia grisea]TLD03754.1 hypothetical protein PgNI_11766 [Pyricularia grisea]
MSSPTISSALKKQCLLEEPGRRKSESMALDVDEVLFENILLESDDDDQDTVQGDEQDPEDASDSDAYWDQATQTFSTRIDWQGAMQSLTMTAAHVLNLEKEIFDVSRDITAFVEPGSSLEAKTFEVPMSPLHPSAAVEPDAVAYLTVEELLQLTLYIPHMRLLSEIMKLKEHLAENDWSCCDDHRDQDNDECVVIIDEEEFEAREKLIYNIAVIASKAGHLEDLISIILPKWRWMMADTVTFGKDIQKAAILDQFVDSILRWAIDYAARSEAFLSDDDI